MMTEPLAFHSWMKQRRIELDLSRQDLAMQVGCSLATIRQLEQATRRPSRQMAERLARYLEIPPEQLSQFMRAARVRLVEHGEEDEPEREGTPGARPAPPPGATPLEAAVLIGRERELAELGALLLGQERRLVTLIGPGGVGKTSLALRLAADLCERFPDGAHVVALATLREAALIAKTIASALQLLAAHTPPTIDRLVELLRGRRMLLVLDNFEHLQDGAPLVTELLAGCPGLTLLVTSRSALHLHNEQLYVVPPLGLPELSPSADGQTRAAMLQDYAAVRLFVKRARMAAPAFELSDENAETIAEICRHLDGLPLAIELAAARVRALPPRAMLSRLNNRLALLTGGGVDLPERQQTMRALIEWSYNLLDPQEQLTLRRLAAFAGPWTLEAAEALCPSPGPDQPSVLDLTISLLDKSLLQEHHRAAMEAGYSMMETIREYLLERLEQQGETEQALQRLAEYYLELAAHASGQITGARQQLWIERLEWEHDNLRAALGWLIASAQSEPALHLIGLIWKFWQVRHHHSEALQWIQRALALPPEQTRDYQISRSRALWGAGWLASDTGNDALVRAVFPESLQLAREAQDPRGIALALHGVGALAQGQGDFAAAMAAYDESREIFELLDDQEELAWTLRHQGLLLQNHGRYHEAVTLYQQALELFRGIKHAWGIGRQLIAQAHALIELGEYAQASALLEESLELSRGQGNRDQVMEALRFLGRAALDQGQYDQAERYFGEALEIAQELKQGVGMRWSLAYLGWVEMARGNLAQARALLNRSLALTRESGIEWAVEWTLARLGRVALEAGELEQARQHFARSLDFHHRHDLRWGMPECLEGLAAIGAASQPDERALRRVALLLSSADALRASLSSIRPRPDLPPYQRALDALRAQLSPAAFEQAWRQGAAMPLDQVVALALERAG